MPSNSSFFHRKRMSRISALELSSTIGAEITAPKASPTCALCVATAAMIDKLVLKIKATKTATTAPQKKAGQHPKRLSFIAIDPKQQHNVNWHRQGRADQTDNQFHWTG